jgi:RNA polymerase sigma-70 factor (ECF subfamily)
MADMSPRPESPPPPVGDSANEAMERYADGDASAFPALYDAIAPRIERLVRRRTRDLSRIDDIVQQTFERIHRARGSFIRGADVVSWAFAIARNLCVDFGTQGWRAQEVEGDSGTDPLSEAVAEVIDAERVAVARDTLARLITAFRRLPLKQQLALELVRVEGFSMGAAAENLGVTLPTVKMAVFRGAAALRAAIGEEPEPRRPSRGPFSTIGQEQPHGAS